MPSISKRDRSISTKVTDEEYHQIVAAAEPKTISEWARAILIRASEPVDLEFLLLTEVLALRTIVLNLNFALAEGGPPLAADVMKRLIERADSEKVNRAHKHVAELKAAGNPTSRWRGHEDRL